MNKKLKKKLNQVNEKLRKKEFNSEKREHKRYGTEMI